MVNLLLPLLSKRPEETSNRASGPSSQVLEIFEFGLQWPTEPRVFKPKCNAAARWEFDCVVRTGLEGHPPRLLEKAFEDLRDGRGRTELGWSAQDLTEAAREAT